MDGLADRDSLQRWWEEHSELDRLVADVEDSLNGGRLDAAQVALAALAEALESHFNVEERVYFPLVERFSPEHAAIVRGARMGHARVTESLDTLREVVERGEIAAARRALAMVLDLFRRHEGEEAKLIAELELNERLS
jgi:iron-sulfur cluster repair protein YtfE (RIC family)